MNQIKWMESNSEIQNQIFQFSIWFVQCSVNDEQHCSFVSIESNTQFWVCVCIVCASACSAHAFHYMN